MVENDVVKSYGILTSKLTIIIIQHHRPDITATDKTSRKCLIVDVIILGDQNIAKKGFEKINNYSERRVEIARVWNMEKEVVPVVTGALGFIPKNLHRHLERLGIKVHVPTMQKSALLGTAYILPKVLSV